MIFATKALPVPFSRMRRTTAKAPAKTFFGVGAAGEAIPVSGSHSYILESLDGSFSGSRLRHPGTGIALAPAPDPDAGSGG
jgi:hypothetical protein